MTSKFHRAIEKLLKSHDLSEDVPPENLDTWKKFLSKINNLILGTDQDRYLLEQSLNLSSDEMNQRAVELRKSEQKWKSLVLHLPVIILVVNRNGIITYSNISSEKYLNIFKLNEIFFQSFSAEINRQLKDTLDLVFETGVIQNKEAEVYTNDINYFFSVRMAIIPDKEKTQNAILMFSDMSEKIKILKELEDQKTMIMFSSKMAAVGEMVAGIAHEINNPLTVIGGYLYFLNKMVKNKSFDEDLYKEYITKIQDTIQRITKIAQGLLLFSRNESLTSFSLEKLSDIIDQTIIFCTDKFKENNVKLNVNIIDKSIQIECFPVQISQVILNLLNNAVDAIKNENEKWVNIDVHDLNELIEISVTDSGPGIPVELRDKILKPFFTSKKAGEGTGLGLAVSQGIIKKHNGHLFLDGEFSRTKFVIRLPKTQNNLDKFEMSP